MKNLVLEPCENNVKDIILVDFDKKQRNENPEDFSEVEEQIAYLCGYFMAKLSPEKFLGILNHPMMFFEMQAILSNEFCSIFTNFVKKSMLKSKKGVIRQ